MQFVVRRKRNCLEGSVRVEFLHRQVFVCRIVMVDLITDKLGGKQRVQCEVDILGASSRLMSFSKGWERSATLSANVRRHDPFALPAGR